MPLLYNWEQGKPPPLIASTHTKCIVTIEVGPARRAYYMHKAFLTQHSVDFAKALPIQWQEAEEKMLWLRDAELKYPDDWARIVGREDTEDYILEDITASVLKAYVLTDRLLAHKLRRELNNTTVKYSLIAFMVREHATASVTYTFNNISAERPTTRLLVDDFCERCRDSESGELYLVYDEWLEATHTAIVRRVKRTLQNARSRPKCDFGYLEHVSCAAMCDRRHTTWNADRQFLAFAPIGKFYQSQACLP